MPRKRETEKKTTPTVTVKAAELPDIKIRCIYESKLIIGGDRTPSGTRYEFNTGEIQPVREIDYPMLLAMETRPAGCCGGTTQPQKFFEEV